MKISESGKRHTGMKKQTHTGAKSGERNELVCVYGGKERGQCSRTMMDRREGT